MTYWIFATIVVACVIAWGMAARHNPERTDPTDPDLEAEVKVLLGYGERTRATRLVHKRTGLGLVESRDYVTNL
jgi:hypothetical protein